MFVSASVFLLLFLPLSLSPFLFFCLYLCKNLLVELEAIFPRSLLISSKNKLKSKASFHQILMSLLSFKYFYFTLLAWSPLEKKKSTYRKEFYFTSHQVCFFSHVCVCVWICFAKMCQDRQMEKCLCIDKAWALNKYQVFFTRSLYIVISLWANSFLSNWSQNVPICG